MGRAWPNNGKSSQKLAQKKELSEKWTKGPIYTKQMCCQVTGLRLNAGRVFECTDACIRSQALRSNANNRHNV
jgi:hypothetical protein